MIIEEGTSFAKLYGEGSPLERDLPSEEEERLMYEKTEEILGENGYIITRFQLCKENGMSA